MVIIIFIKREIFTIERRLNTVNSQLSVVFLVYEEEGKNTYPQKKEDDSACDLANLKKSVIGRNDEGNIVE